ncbi:MAG: repair protein RecN [Pseudomonadota bacterium]|jgi:DNA repair protein RecN (Recombination protein N)
MSLRRIALRDFVIVQTLDLELAPGFTVLTGETGAGKSILIDALQLALGARAQTGVVREGASRCEIAAEFDNTPATTAWLDEEGFAHEDSLLVKRTLDTEGRSKAWINGSVATVTQLKSLADALVDIHGQHAWQSLTRTDAVRDLLDAYAGVDTQTARGLWSAWRQHRKALDEATASQAQSQQEMERLSWQIGELDKLSPQPDEWPELNTQHGRLANAQGLIEAAEQAAAALDDESPSAADLIQRALHQLEGQAHIEPRFAEPIEALNSALAQVQDARHTLNQLSRHMDTDPATLQALDDRLSLWMSLAKRYRRTPEDLVAFHSESRAQLAKLESFADLEGLQAAERAAWKTFTQAIDQLSAQRQQAAPRLSKAVTETMQTLGMAGGRFEVSLTRLDTPQAPGWEQVEFLVAGHAGVTPRPVGKVASGGELSRIALALSVITSQLGQAPTLIFDEVDSGIGGAVAHTVGQLLRQLGQDRQVLAVTHLAQVAASADQHCLVSKQAAQGHTLSQVAPIEGEDRVLEIARMLGGSGQSQASLAHARELLQP